MREAAVLFPLFPQNLNDASTDATGRLVLAAVEVFLMIHLLPPVAAIMALETIKGEITAPGTFVVTHSLPPVLVLFVLRPQPLHVVKERRSTRLASGALVLQVHLHLEFVVRHMPE